MGDLPRSAFSVRHVGPNADGSALGISWQDGHHSEYPPRYLRLTCRCAGCIDEMTGRRTLRPETVPEGIHPRAIHYVGKYALQFVWSDGHDTGIYPFEYLRRLCPCDSCSAQEASDAAGPRPSPPG